MKVVINTCFGGYGLSRLATKRLAQLQGRECYFFDYSYETKLLVPLKDNEKVFCWHAFDIPNPTSDSYKTGHHIDNCNSERHNTFLVQVVDELGEKANGSCAKLKIVEIPGRTEYIIEEYDGNEHIAEQHKTWS